MHQDCWENNKNGKGVISRSTVLEHKYHCSGGDAFWLRTEAKVGFDVGLIAMFQFSLDNRMFSECLMIVKWNTLLFKNGRDKSSN